MPGKHSKKGRTGRRRKRHQANAAIAGLKAGTTRVFVPFKIYLNGVDVTPERIVPFDYKDKSRPRHAGKGSTDRLKTSYAKLKSDLQKYTTEGDTVFRQTYISSGYVDDIVIEPVKWEESVISEEFEEILDLRYCEPKEAQVMPTHISLILSETPTFFIFELPSQTVDEDSDEVIQVQTENGIYEYLTEGKGRNRKMVNAEVQTIPILLQSRSTEAPKVRRRNNSTFATNWEMYDTYEKREEVQTEEMKDFVVGENYDNKSLQDEDTEVDSADQEMMKLLQNDKFLEAICVIERLLANNNFNEQQKRFKGLSDPYPFRENIEYRYRLDLLWTFANKETSGRCVSAMCWNPANSDILAVAYGKFYYTDRATGMVMIWNIKNPNQPERSYNFEQSVTAINFSKHHPNILGIGFYNGDVKLLDITARTVEVTGQSGKDSPSFEPIWQVVFYPGSDYFKDEEQIITAGEDGRISHYRTQDIVELIFSQIMRIGRPEGKLKGVETLRRCHVSGIPVTRYAAALVIQQHPVDANIYYVGTNEGTIHKCSKNYHHQHLDLFLAHDGPVYEMKFSPFCNRLFLTCGDDWNVRIWIEGIAEPLFELSKAMKSVQGADWSPTHSTIVANISGADIYIWDLQRKTYQPQSVTTTPENCRNTVIQFTESGRCLVVGDIEGNVHVYSLEDMPFPAFFQDDLLISAVVRNLITRPDLVKRLKKFGSLNFEKMDNRK